MQVIVGSNTAQTLHTQPHTGPRKMEGNYRDDYSFKSSSSLTPDTPSYNHYDDKVYLSNGVINKQTTLTSIQQKKMDARLSTNSSISTNSDGGSDYSTSVNVSVSSSLSPSPLPATSAAEETLYVAIDKDLKEGQSVLSWALANSGGRKICLIHVHRPPEITNFMAGGRLGPSFLREQAERRERMQHILDGYLLICARAGVQAEKLHIETNLIDRAIVEIITRFGIRRLVMGAAASTRYSRKLTSLKSKKAKYVNAKAPFTCHIWFVCKGQLIYTREGSSEVTSVETTPEVMQLGPNSGTERTDPVIARSATVRPSTQLNPISTSHNHRRAISANPHGMTVPEIHTGGEGGMSTSNSAHHSESDSEEHERTSKIHLSACSSSGTNSSIALTPYLSAQGSRGSQDDMRLSVLSPKDDDNQESPPSILEEKTVDYQLYYQLEQAMLEARNSRRDAFEESVRRGKAEQDAVDAIIRARTSEKVYTEELKQRKELEAALLRVRFELEQAMAEAINIKREASEESMRRGKAEQEAVDSTHRVSASEKVYTEELKHRKELEAALVAERSEREKIQSRHDKDRDELQRARVQQLQLERRITESAGLFIKYKKERDQVQMELDNALHLAEDLRRQQAESPSTNLSNFFSEFSFIEIEEATRSFHPSLKIGEGDYGTIYKGLLRHTEVAIKMLHAESFQGPSEYQHEVDILSKLRHPNIVTLIGACPDYWTLIYEYLPNGSLEDRLNCKDNSAPLSWQTRIRIAAELCSALVFLHSSKPHGIVHGDLKPSNVLLDGNFVSKLRGVGIRRVVLPDEHASVKGRASYGADSQGKFAHMDPELLISGELTTKSDVYSFGIVLLRLLTGKPALNITTEVQNALDDGNLKSLLDYSAGDWPYVQAHQLAHLALRCITISDYRPDLGSEVWRVLQAMQASCIVSSSSVRSEDPSQAPHYFICPIFQEVMQDPHVAADGFTYEAEALRGWLDSGHDTSPMTNLQLENKNLVPNLALRSAIQEWMQRQT